MTLSYYANLPYFTHISIYFKMDYGCSIQCNKEGVFELVFNTRYNYDYNIRG